MTRVGSGGARKRSWRSEARADDAELGKDLVALGQKVAALRQKASLTQEALATKASLDARHLQDIEYGKSNVTIATLRAVARALGVTSVAELLKDVC